LSLDTGLEPDEAAEAYPFLNAYQLYVKCKNLGININASDLDPEVLDALHTILETIEDLKSKSKKGPKHGKQ
jgi:hypothetical protein